MGSISTDAAGSTIRRKFTTRDSGVPATLTTGTVSVYKDDSLTQSTTGVSLTADFDSVTGLNHVAIDTSADGTFYSNGSHFELVLTAGTVAGTTVIGEVVGSFDLAAAIGTATGGVNVTQIAGQTASAAGAVTFPGTIASTTNITAGTMTTTTNLTNLPSIPANWLTAAGIAASALNGKGDWLLSSSYTAPPSVGAIDTQLSGTHGAGAWGGGGSVDVISINGNTFSGANIPAILADAVAHGGTPGSSTATLAMQSINVTNPSGTAATIQSTGSNGQGLHIQGSGFGEGMFVAADPSGIAIGFSVQGGGNGGSAAKFYGFTGAGMEIYGDRQSGTHGNPGLWLEGTADMPGLLIQVQPNSDTGIASAAAVVLDPDHAYDVATNNTGEGVLVMSSHHGIHVATTGSGFKALRLAGDAATDSLAIAAGAGSPIDIFDAEGRVKVSIPGL